jgi:hypothetical protein
MAFRMAPGRATRLSSRATSSRGTFRPDAVGLALPGMPADSPGMGGDVGTWESQPVMLIQLDGAMVPFDY